MSSKPYSNNLTYTCPKCDGEGEGDPEELDFEEYDAGECRLCNGSGEVRFATYVSFVKKCEGEYADG